MFQVKAGPATDDLDRIPTSVLVTRHQRNALVIGLSDEHPVEWIAM
jgi:hypothetical protein